MSESKRSADIGCYKENRGKEITFNRYNSLMESNPRIPFKAVSRYLIFAINNAVAEFADYYGIKLHDEAGFSLPYLEDFSAWLEKNGLVESIPETIDVIINFAEENGGLVEVDWDEHEED